MIECQIYDMRKELDDLIARGASFQEIYTMSLILDELIVAFYTQSALKSR